MIGLNALDSNPFFNVIVNRELFIREKEEILDFLLPLSLLSLLSLF